MRSNRGLASRLLLALVSCFSVQGRSIPGSNHGLASRLILVLLIVPWFSCTGVVSRAVKPRVKTHLGPSAKEFTRCLLYTIVVGTSVLERSR